MLNIIIANWEAISAVGTALWTLYLQVTKEPKTKKQPVVGDKL